MQFLKLSITLVCLSLFIFTTESQLYNMCPNTTTFTRNSTYQSNRNLLLSSLTSNTTLNNNGFTNGFYTDTAGRNTTEPAYGLFLCRGDVTPSTCQDCVTVATSNITQLCPNETDAIIWYDYCLLRYSNNSLSMDSTRRVYMWNLQNITNPQQFNALLGDTMNDAATQASNSSKRFATKEANFTAFQRLYTLVQCTRDLTSLDCNTCLRQIIADLPSCCDGKQGGRVLTPSCNFRYEMYPFYNETLTAAPAPSPVILPPPPPPASVTRPKGKVFLWDYLFPF